MTFYFLVSKESKPHHHFSFSTLSLSLSHKIYGILRNKSKAHKKMESKSNANHISSDLTF
jgi:hypothetical protein